MAANNKERIEDFAVLLKATVPFELKKIYSSEHELNKNFLKLLIVQHYNQFHFNKNACIVAS